MFELAQGHGDSAIVHPARLPAEFRQRQAGAAAGHPQHQIAPPIAMAVAARDLAPLLDAAEAPDTHLVLMPVPASTGTIDANRQLANELAAEVHRRYPSRRVQIKITVGRQHPVESSCVRRRRGEAGLSIDQHAFLRVAGPLTATGTAYYFVDNMATTGRTLAACRAALGFGDGIVWADQGIKPHAQ